MENGAHYVLFKDFRNPRVYHEEGTDFGMLNKGMFVFDNWD